jgi:hypothetical protein
MRKTFLIMMVSALCNPVLSMAETIVFEDAAVKAVCIANWDTDGDGELSEDEAVAVTSLGEAFRDNKEIGAFPELKYFTRLTEIGEHAFSGSTISGELHIPGTVEAIGDYAFYNCRRLTAVVLEEGVKRVGWHSFSGPIRTMVLPKSLTFMSSMAIDPYVNADPSSGIFIPEGDLTVYSLAPKPADIDGFAFYFVYGGAHLVVPHGCKEAYRASGPWSRFGEYIEVGDVNRDGKLNVADITRLIAYVTGREYTEIEARIADVNGDGAVDADDVTLLCSYILG